MRRLFVCTVGWTETPIVKLVLRHGLKEDDYMLLIRPLDVDPKAEDTVKTVQQFISKSIGRDASSYVKQIRVDVLNFYSALVRIREELERLSPAEIIVNLSGGMRALVLETLTAVLAYKTSQGNWENTSVEVELENRSGNIQIGGRIFGIISSPLREEMKDLLRELKKGDKRIGELAERFGVDLATAYRWVTRLRKEGVVELRREGGRKGSRVHLTDEAAAII
jgi:CRISPR-associated protein Csa3